jgi:hypothetical protein
VYDLLTRHSSVRERGRIVSLACRPSIVQSSALLHDIDVSFDAGEPLRLVAKGLGSNGLADEAKPAKPRFVADDRRERFAYERLLPALDAGAPRLFGVVVDSQDTSHLILERRRGVPIWQRQKGEAWYEAARHLARLHLRAQAADVCACVDAAPLLRYDASMFEAWRLRATRFDRGPRHEMLTIARGHEKATQWLVQEPVGVLHGEPYPSNVLIDDAGGTPAVCLIDWEMVAVGPQLLDLAHLVAGRWTDGQRSAIVETYRAEQLALGASPSSCEQLLMTLDCGLLHLAVQNLGWSDAWTPPPQQAHDWRGEALRLSRKWQP